jgi:hypothetical protein
LIRHFPLKAESSGRMTKMAKEIILYNLAENVTDEEYKDYVTREKGPLLESLPSVKKYEVVRIKGAATGEIPYNYVGIIHVSNLDEFYQKDKKTQKFQDFLNKLMPMLKNIHILYGEEIY